MNREWLDLSIPLATGMERSFAYPPPAFEPTIIGTQPNGEPVHATRIEMYSHVGTHIESARHVFGEGATLDDFSVDRFIGPAVALDLSGVEDICIDAGPLEAAAVRAGSPAELDDCFVLLSLAHREPSPSGTTDHAYLSEEAARWLVEHRVRGLGVDCPTPDMAVHRRKERLDIPVHRVLLSEGLLIIENLSPRVRQVAGRRGVVHACPLAISGADSSPVRVVFSPDT